MSSVTRTALTAIVLAASVSMAQAQTPSDQDHAAHHPPTQGAEQTPAPSTMPMGGGGGRPAMMGTDMTRMMEMMRGMMGSMAGQGQTAASGESVRMGEMMQSMGQMMRTMGRMMAEHGMGAGMALFRHIEGQLAYYKAELGITDAQLPQWNAFADAARAAVKTMREPYMQSIQADASVPVPEQLDRRIAMLSAEIETEKTVGAALKSLYSVLSPDQKKVADEMVAEHLQAMRAAGL